MTCVTVDSVSSGAPTVGAIHMEMVAGKLACSFCLVSFWVGWPSHHETITTSVHKKRVCEALHCESQEHTTERGANASCIRCTSLVLKYLLFMRLSMFVFAKRVCIDDLWKTYHFGVLCIGTAPSWCIEQLQLIYSPALLVFYALFLSLSTVSLLQCLFVDPGGVPEVLVLNQSYCAAGKKDQRKICRLTLRNHN